MLRFLYCLSLLVLLSPGCSKKEKGVRGEIVGVQARVSLADFQDNEIKRVAYAGNLAVLLPDSQQVVVACPKELLPRIRECPYFNVDSVDGDYLATITLKVEEHQEIVLIRNEAGEWVISEIVL